MRRADHVRQRNRHVWASKSCRQPPALQERHVTPNGIQLLDRRTTAQEVLGSRGHPVERDTGCERLGERRPSPRDEYDGGNGLRHQSRSRQEPPSRDDRASAGNRVGPMEGDHAAHPAATGGGNGEPVERYTGQRLIETVDHRDRCLAESEDVDVICRGQAVVVDLDRSVVGRDDAPDSRRRIGGLDAGPEQRHQVWAIRLHQRPTNMSCRGTRGPACR